MSEGHAIFHVVLGAVIGLAAWWLRRQEGADGPSRFAQWAALALAITQFAEGVAAIPEGSGDSIGHEILGTINLVALQPMVLVAIIVLAVVAFSPPVPFHWMNHFTVARARSLIPARARSRSDLLVLRPKRRRDDGAPVMR